MPLRARLNGKEIAAYSYDDRAWKRLKAAYRKNRLQMACCDREAVPKTSKLGTQYFAHKQKGDCPTAPETKEHLYLKDLAARAAAKNGWQVETESVGQTPEGEEWSADVLCSKQKSRMAIEIQWSHQSVEEYERRQRKYAASNVLGVWLYRLQGSKQKGYKVELQDSYELPVFGIAHDRQTGEMRVPKFRTGIEDFVSGMMSGRLKFSPKPGEVLTAQVLGAAVGEPETCWHCGCPMKYVTGFDIVTTSGDRLRFAQFGEDGVAELIERHVPDHLLASLGYGRVSSRYIHQNQLAPDCGLTCRRCHRNNSGFYCGDKSYGLGSKPVFFG
ncbi:competence protein CoiA [Synechococcus sp. PCC 7336]|uniref:competence protein CoiA n=1 Tax=Synechococcus sp. PCC 7336 TaxID=195250 RepID=UPI00034600E0|nr:competence protein CoiA family protein [Synechococcus sp. PCC 7336]